MRNLKVFSEEWTEDYVNALNNNANYKAAASWWTGDFIFEVEPNGNLDHKITMFIGL
ncbi:unnamed protein product, partial [marine sediment metagenome]